MISSSIRIRSTNSGALKDKEVEYNVAQQPLNPKLQILESRVGYTIPPSCHAKLPHEACPTNAKPEIGLRVYRGVRALGFRAWA